MNELRNAIVQEIHRLIDQQSAALKQKLTALEANQYLQRNLRITELLNRLNEIAISANPDQQPAPTAPAD